MEQGKLAKWLVKEGDAVRSGDVIAEIETDKATMEVEAVDEGTIGKIMIAEGSEGVAVNTPIALLLGEGEDVAALKGYGAEPPQPAPAGASQPGMQPALHVQSSAQNAAQANGGQGMQAAAGVQNGSGGRIFASPLARRLASQAGLDLKAIRGSGPRGRIVRHDIEAAETAGTALSPPPAVVAPAEAATAAPGQALALPRNGLPQPMSDEQILAVYEEGSYTVQPHDNMRKTIAQRLTQAKVTVPHFYLSIDCELDALLAARARLNDRAPKDGPGAYKLSVNDFIIKAMGLALQRVPKANATWTERGILLHKRADVAVAVAVEGGLFTPVLRDVEHKTLAQLSHEMKDLAERARRRRLAPHEYQGGTTAISNLGMYGIRRFDAVINPPHATILAVGAGEQRPVVRGGKVEVATMMSCTLSCDHRVVDGALGAELLAVFKGFIEEPVTMLV
jgi:pyruvate dehydrogenase E2 component (dihydrolipoamide acetyltransferase)